MNFLNPVFVLVIFQRIVQGLVFLRVLRSILRINILIVEVMRLRKLRLYIPIDILIGEIDDYLLKHGALIICRRGLPVILVAFVFHHLSPIKIKL